MWEWDVRGSELLSGSSDIFAVVKAISFFGLSHWIILGDGGLPVLISLFGCLET